MRFTTSERLLAPDAGFARQVLPAVRTGLAAQLDGVPGWSVAVVDAAGGTVASLAEEAPKPGSTVAVALDRTLQAAAEDAVEPLAQQTVLVAIQPSTGNLVAWPRTVRRTPRGHLRSPAASRRAPRSRS